MLPVGVLIPTRNSAPLLAAHLDAAEAWTGSVEEIVVVDSESTDGTREMLRARLRHPRLKLLEHPRGLYQSWNFGIRQLSAEQCYISTVGETITLGGLQHLSALMREQQCDVVISKPLFVDLLDRPMPTPEWPIDKMVRALDIRHPRTVSGALLFLLTLANFREAILGSSASNLYRTRCLQELPFPTEYGTVGDGGWGLAHCCRIRLGITPEVFSTFREHPKAYSRAEYAVDDLTQRLLDRIVATFHEERTANPAFASVADDLNFEQIIALLQRQAECQGRLERCRTGNWPWSLNPVAWIARTRRSALRRRIDRLKTVALHRLAAGS